MKITFIGVGSAFTTMQYYQSNMLITAASGKKLLLDCGSDARFALAEQGIQNHNVAAEINALYISHLHADHIGGLEWFVFNSYFRTEAARPMLFMETGVMHRLWDQSLRGGLGRIAGKCMHLTDFFACQPISEQGSFVWEGLRCSLFKMPHVLTGYDNHYSFGLLIEAADEPQAATGAGKRAVFISTDTHFQPDLLGAIADRVDLIFHDCETSPYRTGVHAHYHDLCTLPEAVKRKMWLYHYQPNPPYHPEADGFHGFVQKGQMFQVG